MQEAQKSVVFTKADTYGNADMLMLANQLLPGTKYIVTNEEKIGPVIFYSLAGKPGKYPSSWFKDK
jgi:hypothetical protein